MHFVFFGGTESKIRVLDMLTSKLLPGQLKPSVKDIYSLQACVKSQYEIYLAVSESDLDYSDDKTDLFDLTDFFRNGPVIL